MIARADQRARAAWRLGPVDAVRAAVRAGRTTRRQLALVADVEGRLAPPIPGSGCLERTDAATFTSFAELVPETSPSSILELLWYERFATEGADTFLVARAADGSPTFATWLLDAEGQARHPDRFVDGFHPLGPDEMLLEGIFVFPWARRRGVGTAGIGAASAWAADRGARRVWSYPYLDNHRVLPALARCGFAPDHVRVETSSFGQARGVQEPLTASDRAMWQAAARVGAVSR